MASAQHRIPNTLQNTGHTTYHTKRTYTQFKLPALEYQQSEQPPIQSEHFIQHHQDRLKSSMIETGYKSHTIQRPIQSGVINQDRQGMTYRNRGH